MKYKIWDKKDVSDFLPKDHDKDIFKKYEDQRHLQIIHLPDVSYSGSNLDPYVLVERKPEEVRTKAGEKYSISEVKEMYGNYTRSEAIREALLLNDQASFPIHEKCLILRPEKFENHKYWISCPSCGENTGINTDLQVKTGETKLKIDIQCTECESSVTNKSEGQSDISRWAHCPICGSSNINYECSLPYGFINFSCDSCHYDTKPTKTDTGFSEINFRID
jgi:hypothetical protein